VDVKQAVRTAKHYISDLYNDEGAHGFSLEEVEFVEAPLPSRWLVTLSFSRQQPTDGDPLFAAIRQFDRTYKQIAIQDSDGAVLSMKIRELAGRAA
jgi:hypothetical protein